MEMFTNKLGPTFSPWSNGINERNHYIVDVAVKKIMGEDQKITLQEAVNMAGGMHSPPRPLIPIW